ncbi:MAG: septum formation initiator family protein [Verrucomicrobia bacterium]|nr:septum formation initiator family protein [bacterium]NDA09498.1 septum formation initiator family protein [Verrucomicrobiota bacterium]NDA25833.1 septum formation initiator family protein [Verrucomicrobiota bacterium]NDD56366.1 septum formation initiator family protein [Verrucomicrobiota bacterium]NDD81535.1 septum formation initiator family protein [Verrucomicrobiota bacterium]
MADNSRLFDPRGFGAPAAKGHFWRVIQPWVYALVGLLAVAVVLALFYPAWKRGQRLKEQTEYLQNQITKKKQELADLQEESGRLKDDPFTVERMSRDTLNVARPGEVIFKFQPYATNSNAPGEARRVVGSQEASQKP